VAVAVTYVQKIAVLFLALIAAGTASLSMPGVTVNGDMTLVDAVFMATSAVCVTGLATLDMGKDITTLGHVIILVLIQLGGIGIAAVASMIILTGRRLSLEYESMLDSSIAVTNATSKPRIVLLVILYTLAFEFLGALALSFFWTGDVGMGERIWLSIFHAVSAFCNAGFSLFSTNLEAYRGNVGVNAVIMVLIVVGGIGFMNIQELAQHVRTRMLRWSRFSLFLKLSIFMILVLNSLGFAILLAAESENAFAALPWSDKIMAALFHAITARTAGFDTIPISTFTNFSLLILVFLMFVGGGSGSCAGGIKITTIAVIVATFRSYFRNLRDPVLFGRRLAYVTQRKASVLAMTSMFVIFVGVGAVDLLDDGLSQHATAGRKLSDYMFEVVSAAGTVGLSTGITPGLSVGAKLVLVVLMFVGRLGPLVVIEAWAASVEPEHFTSPEEVVPVG
jgi:trk system potassium uptake protein TrkH